MTKKYSDKETETMSLQDANKVFDDWWEDTGSLIEWDDTYYIAQQAFLCGFHTKRGKACDGKFRGSKKKSGEDD